MTQAMRAALLAMATATSLLGLLTSKLVIQGADGKVLAGFAGAAADAFTLFERFEEKLKRYPENLPRAAVELDKEWRSDRVLRRLEALLALADRDHCFVVSGSGELIEPDDGVLAIGSGETTRWPPQGR